jgi:hypothetical protein
MITWRLWRALCNPPSTHPLFRRSSSFIPDTRRLVRELQIAAVYLGSCLVLSLIWPLLVSNALGALIVAIVTGNTFYSLGCTRNISAAIAHERELETYELLCLTPAGALGVGWALSTAQLYRSPIFQITRLIVRLIAIAVTGALLIFLIWPLVTAFNSESDTVATSQLLVRTVQAIALALGLYVDYVQSVILAQVIGMLSPVYTQSRFNAQLAAAGGFLLLQLLTLLAALILVISLNGILHQPLFSNAVIPVLGLIVFFAVREAFIMILWLRLMDQLNSSPQDAELDGGRRLGI